MLSRRVGQITESLRQRGMEVCKWVVVEAEINDIDNKRDSALDKQKLGISVVVVVVEILRLHMLKIHPKLGPFH